MQKVAADCRAVEQEASELTEQCDVVQQKPKDLIQQNLGVSVQIQSGGSRCCVRKFGAGDRMFCNRMLPSNRLCVIGSPTSKCDVRRGTPDGHER